MLRRRAFAALLAILAVTELGCGDPCEGTLAGLCPGAAQTLPLVVTPRGAAGLDVDGDGQGEVVILGRERLVLIRSDGRTRSFPLPGVASGLASGDVDGDGRPDVAVALSDDDAILLFLGDADGLTQGPTIAVGDGPIDLVSGDLDGDGASEVISADVRGGSVSVVRGGASTRVAVGGTPRALALADLDGDGHLDLVVGDFEDGALHLLRGGAGGLGEAVLVVAADGAGIERLALGDLDGDPHPDLVIGRARGTIEARLGDGAGGFGEALPLEGVPWTSAGGFVLAPRGDAQAAALLVPGGVGLTSAFFVDGGWAGRDSLELGPLATLVALGPTWARALSPDLGGAIDLTIAPAPAPFLRWQSPPPAEPLLSRPRQPVAIADLDGDGDLDLAVLEATSARVFLGDGAGGFSEGARARFGGSATTLLAADVDGDGRVDLIGAGGEIDLQAALATPEGDYVAGPSGAIPGGVTAAAVLRGPSRDRLALVSDEELLSIVGFDPSGWFEPPIRPLPEDAGSLRIAAIDLDGDGTDDLAVAAKGVQALLDRGDAFEVGPLVAVSGVSAIGARIDDQGPLVIVAGGGGVELIRGLETPTPSVTHLDAPLPWLDLKPDARAYYTDVDADGIDDVLVTGRGQLVVARGDPGRAHAISHRTFGWGNLALAADLDDDGEVEVISGRDGMIERYDLREAPWPSPTFAAPLPAPLRDRRVTHGDLDGDGADELLFSRSPARRPSASRRASASASNTTSSSAPAPATSPSSTASSATWSAASASTRARSPTTATVG
ncbi:MAG: VCBS repeat-containing protein [Myxococcales bacterium]|nr:VCBS repeat-containing protein [Myxococcales bacterium]